MRSPPLDCKEADVFYLDATTCFLSVKSSIMLLCPLKLVELTCSERSRTMKHRKIIKIIWVVVCSFVALSMIVFTVAPAFGGGY